MARRNRLNLPDNAAGPILPVVTDVPKPFDTLREHTSYSQIDTYDRCSLKHKFRYVDGQKGLQNLNMTRGTAGHRSLELNSLHKIETGNDQPLEQMLDNFSDSFTAELADNEHEPLKPEESIGGTKDATAQALTIWRHKFAPQYTPIAAELELLVPLPQDDLFPDIEKPILAKIDSIRSVKRVVMTAARPVIRTVLNDNKFPGRLPSNLQALADISTQLDSYDLIMALAGTPTDDVGYEHFVPPTKTLPARILRTYRALDRMTPDRRAARHARALHKIRTLARAIKHGIFVPTDDPRVCSGCEFRLRCQDSLVKSDFDAIAIQALAGETP